MTMTEVALTDRAAQRICEIVANDKDAAMLRVSIDAGGCTGFQYNFVLVASRDESDYVLEKQGAMVVIDEVSLPLIAGSEIDFVDDLIGANFKVNNPNASETCGCGVSFTL
ncbi:MAG: iron-sulfur cluster assembly accessory protein [Hyphomicrobiales bacterium]|nr:iron-sulfur cluster assembly accessory protein [Hyphomicrobiales bacterium]